MRRRFGFYRGAFRTEALDGLMDAAGQQVKCVGFYIGRTGLFFIRRRPKPLSPKEGE